MLRLLMLVVLVLVSPGRSTELHAAGSGEASKFPNIVVILADDLGWRDTGFMGSDWLDTPSIDALAAEGVIFDAAYANAPNCAPTRACLLTGLYTPRHGIYTVGSSRRGNAQDRQLVPVSNTTTLGEEFQTLPEVLQGRGYRTGIVGKWHLGDDPGRHGFETSVGGNARGAPKRYFSPWSLANLEDGPEGEYLTDRLTDEAIAFIRSSDDRPFMLYLSHYAVHTPIQPREDLLEAYRRKAEGGGNDTSPAYAAMVASLDESVGRVLAALDEEGIGEDTIVVFFSDNGGHGLHTSMAPLRGSKGMLYEGGIRVPLCIRWRGHVAVGARISEPVIGTDLYPTLLEMAGITPPRDLDGSSLVPLLTGTGGIDRDAIFWHFPSYLEAYRKGGSPWRTTPAGALRSGSWKLMEFFEDGRLELYDLATDPAETRNLLRSEPVVAEQMRVLLHAWREETGATVPMQQNATFISRREPASPVPGPLFNAGRQDERDDPVEKPNIIFIMADDLGYEELGCYGQKKIRTPNIDRIAAEGIRCTQYYAGSPVCAPSRCVLLTGLHTGHAFIRDNGEMPTEGQRPIPADTRTIGELLSDRGYATAAIGKWGLGGPGSIGAPNLQGFDHFFGYLCQRHAHNHYPRYLWRNAEQVILEGNDRGLTGTQYSHDLMTEEALAFVTAHHEQPFFLYLPYAIPHLAIQVPEDSLAEYEGRWDDPPYEGGKGYLPHPAPRAGYAAMVSRMDRDVGRLLDLLDTLDIDEQTLVIFTSDNGPTYRRLGGSDSTFFESAGSLRGLKGSLYEGGIRVPLVARWPGHIKAGEVSDHLCAAWDVLPTLVEVSGADIPASIDGLSFLPMLMSRRGQAEHASLYWEFPSYGGQQAIRVGKWKAIRQRLFKGAGAIELYDLSRDEGEQEDLASRMPQRAAKMDALMRSSRHASKEFPFPVLDEESGTTDPGTE